MKRSLVILLLVACHGEPEKAPPARRPLPQMDAAPAQVSARQVNPRLLRRFRPIGTGKGEPASTAVVDLGRQLFFDKRLSHDNDLSCNSCHRLASYGVDNEPTSRGANGKRGRRNSPTVFHAAAQFTQFWDGRATSVDTQAALPILDKDEMAMASPAMVVSRLTAIPEYVAAFRTAFPDQPNAVTFANVGIAIGAFERGLVTPSRWDRYLSGDHAALTDQEIEGFKSFSDLGCMVCHTGELIGGTSYQRAGAQRPWPNQSDLGRYEVTKSEGDKMMFKVPTLRNIAKTAPYFHDGSAKTLEEAVRMMARYQLDVELGDTELASIVAWLGSLTGELPADYIQEPTLPKAAP